MKVAEKAKSDAAGQHMIRWWMKKLPILILLLIFAPAAASDPLPPMTMTFSFRQAKDACTGYFQSPEIRLQNVPAGATTVRIGLTQKGSELGGQEVSLPNSNIVVAGAIHTQGPCNPGVYTYTATVRSSPDQIIAKAEQSRAFPTDELVQ